jgi:hypothetical protein
LAAARQVLLLEVRLCLSNSNLTEVWAVARSAWQSGDEDGACALWRCVEASVSEFISEALDLITAQLLDAADALLSVASDKWPASSAPQVEYAMLAHRRGDYPEAAARFMTLCRRFPAQSEAAVLGLRALRRLGRLEEAAKFADYCTQALTDNVPVLLESAAVAEARRDLEGVRLLCGEVRKREPQHPESYIMEARALRAAADWNAAERVINIASALKVHHPALRVEECLIAEGRQDLAAMAQLASGLREDYPEISEGYEMGLRSELAAGRWQAAEALFAAVPASLTGDPGLLRIGCNLAMHLQDPALALARCTRAVEGFPESGEFHGIMTVALRDAARHNEAEAFAEKHIHRFPDEPRLAIEYARAAEIRRDLESALVRWKHVLSTFPHMTEGYLHAAGVLMALGRFDDSETIAQAGHARFPGDPMMAVLLGNCASRRRDWPEALRRWKAAAQRFPGVPELAAGLADAQLKLALERADGIEVLSNTTVPPTGNAVRDLVMNFESLGSNCEFGIVQRLAGAEPLGLLRWGNIGVDQVRRMLETRCAGVGEAETTQLTLADDGEYQLSDPRYFSLHTLIYRGQTAEDKLYVRMQRRLQYLSKKLMDDLAAGDKVFVYRQHHEPIPEAEMSGLFKAIRNYGPGRLLCVHKPSNSDHDNTVECLRPGLFVACMSAMTDNPVAASDRFDLWIALLKQVAAAADSGKSP